MVFHDNCIAKFEGNSATTHGGAIYQTHSTLSFVGYSSVTFIGNSAESYVGVVFSEQMSNIAINVLSKLNFTEDTASDGGAVYCQHQVSHLLKNQWSHLMIIMS